MNDKNSLAQSLPLGYSSWRCKYHIVFCTEVSKKSILQGKQKGNRSNSARIVPMETGEYTESDSMSRPY